MISKEKTVTLASSVEKSDLDRLVLIWANKCPNIPDITKKYICGGYQAEYSFEIHYQIAPPGTSDDTRLKAVEALNKFADWANTQRPDIGEGRRALRVETAAFASYLGATSDKYEDYMVPLKLTYEVNV